MSFGFARDRRLTARRQFSAVHEKGKRVGSASFTLLGLPNLVGFSRVGITVSRKIGGAVQRNRIKRVLRDIFRRNPGRSALDLVVVARRGIESRSTSELEGEFVRGCEALARRFGSR